MCRMIGSRSAFASGLCAAAAKLLAAAPDWPPDPVEQPSQDKLGAVSATSGYDAVVRRCHKPPHSTPVTFNELRCIHPIGTLNFRIPVDVPGLFIMRPNFIKFALNPHLLRWSHFLILRPEGIHYDFLRHSRTVSTRVCNQGFPTFPHLHQFLKVGIGRMPDYRKQSVEHQTFTWLVPCSSASKTGYFLTGIVSSFVL